VTKHPRLEIPLRTHLCYRSRVISITLLSVRATQANWIHSCDLVRLSEVTHNMSIPEFLSHTTISTIFLYNSELQIRQLRRTMRISFISSLLSFKLKASISQYRNLHVIKLSTSTMSSQTPSSQQIWTHRTQPLTPAPLPPQ
jgi:hypothetical protein